MKLLVILGLLACVPMSAVMGAPTDVPSNRTIEPVPATTSAPSSEPSLEELEKKFVQDLIKHGNDLVEHSQRLLQEFGKHDKHHLIQNVEHEVKKVQELIHEVTDQLAKGLTVKGDALQEKLLHHEKVLFEELEVVQEVFDEEHERGNATTSVSKLVVAGQQLIKDAKEFEVHLKHHPKELERLNRELTVLEKLVKELQTHPETGKALVKEEEQLIRHEKSLKKLLESLAHSSHDGGFF